MKCSDCVELIARKLDGMLTPMETEQLNTHLAGCVRCRAELALQKKIIGTLKQEIPDGPRRDFTQRVTERAHSLAGRERRRRLHLDDFLPVIPVGATALLIVLFRSEIAGFLSPVMESLAELIGGPLAALGEGLAEALAASSTLTDTDLPGSGLLPRVFSNVYVGAAVSCAAVAWAFSRAYSFVRE
jgi:anti-sigma factor RsiW